MGSTNHYSDIAPESKNPAALVDPNVDGYRRNRGVNYSADFDLTWKVPFVQGLSLLKQPAQQTILIHPKRRIQILRKRTVKKSKRINESIKSEAGI